jgi:hypothetical protein
MKKVISIHQPETFPYPGFFSKMMNSDEFIILDSVQFKKNNYQNRNRIIHEGKSKWLTFPVIMKGHLESNIASTKLADTVDWRSRNLKILEDAYKSCPYYDYHISNLRNMIESSNDNLCEFNMSIIEYIRDCLSINTPLVYASSLDISSHKSDLVFDICKKREATIYLSGEGGRHYLDKSKFEDADIEILYQSFDTTQQYTQRSQEFIPYMSTIDILMNNTNDDARNYIDSAFSYSR